MKKNGFKIYLNNNVHHRANINFGKILPKVTITSKTTKNSGEKVLTSNLIFNFLFWVGNTVFHFFYYSGIVIVSFVIWFLKTILSQLSSNRRKITDYWKLFNNRQFQISFAVFLFLTLCIWGAFRSAKLIAIALELKQKVVNIANQGAGHLLEAEKNIKDNNIEGAQNQFLLALQSFKNSKDQFSQTNQLIKEGINLLPQKRDADRLLSAASYISKSGIEIVSFYDDLHTLKISPQGFSSDGPIKDLFVDMDKQLSASLSDLKTANSLITSINPSNLPGNYTGTFNELKSQLSILENSLTNVHEIFTIAQNMLLGNQKILLLFENNNELRAGGGFIGTYGDANVQDGQIQKLTIGSIYDLDGQLQEKILPPTPMLNVSDRWFMRDSNWFANFPDSAKKISSFYEKEGGETPDTVIAITPTFIIDLLNITGPIDMPAYHVTLSADNFVETTQVATSIDYDKKSNTPKQMLADFFPVLLQHISELTPSQMEQVIIAIQKNLNAKQMVFYSRQSNLQEQLQNFHWTGSIQNTDRDYLSIVSSNLGGTKTDLSLKQTVTLDTTIGDDGNIINHLSITRSNPLPALDETKNVSFLRIYVPSGATLISNSGFDYKNLDSSSFKTYQTDAAVLEWEKSSVKDITSGTFIGQESGKTYFGNWVDLGGGQTKTVELVYKLPFTLANLDHYSLLVQKQIGSGENNFTYNLHFGNRVLEWQNLDTNNLNGNSISENLLINKDYFWGLVLKKN